jgi:hypothetical protein
MYPLVARQRFGKNSPIAAMQMLSKNVTAAKKTYATMEEFLGASFSVQTVT